MPTPKELFKAAEHLDNAAGWQSTVEGHDFWARAFRIMKGTDSSIYPPIKSPPAEAPGKFERWNKQRAKEAFDLMTGTQHPELRIAWVRLAAYAGVKRAASGNRLLLLDYEKGGLDDQTLKHP